MADPQKPPARFEYPEPLTTTRRYPSGFRLHAQTQPGPNSFQLFKLGDNHRNVFQAQQLLNCYIRNSIGGTWRKDNGILWSPVPEDGYLDLDTQAALCRAQRIWGLPMTGCLCPTTRMLLYPFGRLTGTLSLLNPKKVHPTNFGEIKNPKFTPPTPPNPPSKPVTPRTKPVTPVATNTPVTPKKTGGAATTGGAVTEKEPIFTITPSYGVGVSGPIWTSKSSSGNKVAADPTEVDKKTEIDFSFAIPPAKLGDGKLKVTLGAENDSPIDRAHKGQPTYLVSLQLQADDLLKFDWGSVSPFVQGASQWKDADKWKQATTVKAGVELDINLRKDAKIAADVNSGVQVSGPGNDPKTDAKVVVPWEGNVRLQVDF